MESDVGFIGRAGYQFGYTLEGEGQPVLVIGSALYYPKTFSDNLKQNLRFAFVDHRGFAQIDTADPEAICSLDDVLDDVEFLRQELKLGTVVVVGHSGHALLALEYAKKFPQHVSHVVMIAAAPSYSAENQRLIEQHFADVVCPKRKEWLYRRSTQYAAELRESPERRFITHCLALGPRSWYDYRFDATPLWQGVTVNMPIIDHLWGTVFRDIDISQGLEDFYRPVFIALGLHDFLVPPHFTWHPVRSKFQRLNFKIYQRSSHAPQMEDEEAFDEELLVWLLVP